MKQKKEYRKIICPECGGKGGWVVDEHDFEKCDVCCGKGYWFEKLKTKSGNLKNKKIKN